MGSSTSSLDIDSYHDPNKASFDAKYSQQKILRTLESAGCKIGRSTLKNKLNE